MKKLPLTQGKFALLDDDDYEHFKQWKWCASEQGARGHELYYAIRATRKAEGPKRKVWLHKEVARCPTGLVTDHINGDSLDCRKENLRCVTAEVNNLHARIKGWHTRSRATEDDICL